MKFTNKKFHNFLSLLYWNKKWLYAFYSVNEDICGACGLQKNYGMYTYGMYTYGMYTYGMYAYGMYAYGIYAYGMYTYGI